VVAGEPGAGKTLFALQMLFQLAKQGKKCLYFTTLSEPSLKLIRYMQQFSFFDEEVIGRQLTSSIWARWCAAATWGRRSTSWSNRVEREEPGIVVTDSFKAMGDFLGDAATSRAFVHDLAVHIAGWGAATLLVGEYTAEEMASDPSSPSPTASCASAAAARS
jgi:circadian clock protein KaiC